MPKVRRKTILRPAPLTPDQSARADAERERDRAVQDIQTIDNLLDGLPAPLTIEVREAQAIARRWRERR